MKRSSGYSKHLLVLSAVIGAGLIFFFGRTALAQVSIDFPSTFGGFSSQDIKVTIANIVRIVLGFIGILFVLLIMYGGFVWMTSRGLADKVNRAKKIITSAVIGLLIVFAAYSIATFVVQSLQQAASPGGPSGSGFCGDGIVQVPNASGTNEQCDSQPGCQVDCTWPPGVNVVCMSTPPVNPNVVVVCSVLGGTNVGSMMQIFGHNFGSYLSGESKVALNNGSVDVASAQINACGGPPNWSSGYIEAITPTVPTGQYQVVVQADHDSALPFTSPPDDRCDQTPNQSALPFGDCQQINIAAGAAPAIYCMNPVSGLSNGTVQVILDGLNFGAAPGRVEMEGVPTRFTVNNPTPLTNIVGGASGWTDSKITFTVPNTGSPQQAISGNVIVYDTANTPSNGKYFTVTCTTNGQCSSNCCSSNSCQSAAFCAAPGPGTPVITNVIPPDGAIGNYITIQGNNFGTKNGPDGIPGNADDGHLIFTDAKTPTPVQFVDPLAAACGPGVWTNTQIIMQVPVGATLGIGSLQATTNVGPSNTKPFTVNTTVRPGLCSVNPTSGYSGTFFNLLGNNLSGSGKSIFFGSGASKITANNPTYISNTAASGQVPNIVPGDTTVGMTVGGQDSNYLAFRVDGSASGDPIINSISPTNGPAGQYVTIMGANFGNLPGQVFFKPIAPNPGCFGGSYDPDCPGDTSFPAICSTQWWRDDRVVIKTPATAPTGGYFLVVERPGTPPVQSQPGLIPNANGTYTKDTSPLTPGLCYINPTGGPTISTLVTYGGENFSSTQGNVYFDKNQPAGKPPSFIWSNQQILNAQVPAAAVTGSTTVKLSGATGQWSNPLPFFVGSCTSDTQCGGSKCCSGLCRPVLNCTAPGNYDENNWTFTSGQYPFDLANSLACTEDIQSPTPYPYAQVVVFDPTDPKQSAPVNSVIAARFSRPLNYATILANAKIYLCNAGSSFTGACTTDLVAAGAGVFSQVGADGFRWTPNADLAPNTWYEVRFDDGTANSKVLAQDGSKYKGSIFLGVAGTIPSYRWHFHTRTAAQPRCNVTNVQMSPSAINVPKGNTAGPMTATLRDAQCNICTSTGFTFGWSITPPGVPPYADYVPNPAPTADWTNFFGQHVTPAGTPSDVVATIQNPPPGPAITYTPAKLTVSYVTPKVIGYGPSTQCQQVCVNALPYALFNVGLVDPPSLGQAKLYECSDSTCTGLTAVPLAGGIATFVTVTNPNDRINMTPAGALKKGTWYRVIIGQNVTNTENQTMAAADLNYDSNGDLTNDSYTWTFQTSDTVCKPTQIAISPSSAVINSIGGTQNFDGQAIIDDLSCGLVYLNPNDFKPWTWLPANPAGYASIVPTSVGAPTALATALKDTNLLSPPYVAISATIPSPFLTAPVATLSINDLRDPVNLIGHRPDSTGAPLTPPEILATCKLGGLASACPLQCTNVMTSAIFSTFIDQQSLFTRAPSDYSAYYSFNDGSAKDSSINNNAGLFEGAAKGSSANSTYSGLGGGVQLDGINSDVKVGSVLGVNDGTGGSMTAAAWIYFTGNFDDFPMVINKYLQSYFIRLQNGPSVNAFMTRTNGTCTATGNNATQPLALNTWTHVAFTYDNTTGVFTLYVNGAPIVGTCTGSITPIKTNTLPLRIGGRNDAAGALIGAVQFKGTIDDVRIYTRALAAIEINAILADSAGLPSTSGTFNVTNLATGAMVPGTIQVSNYTDPSKGICTADVTRICTIDPDCSNFSAGTCSFKRGRIDFTPNLGTTGTMSGLMAQYTFDDGSAHDSSGNNNNGSISGNVKTISATSQPSLNQVMSYSGQLSDYISVPTSATVDGSSGTISLSAWVYPTSQATCANNTVIGSVSCTTNSDCVNAGLTGPCMAYGQNSWERVFSKAYYTNAGSTGYSAISYIGLINDQGAFSTGIYTGSGSVCPLGSIQKIPKNQWTHLAMTYDGKVMTNYVNGSPTSTTCNALYTPLAKNAYPLGIGVGLDGTNAQNVFKGYIDDVRLYNRGLSSGEIDQVRREGLGITSTAGIYDPSSDYEVRICQNSSCVTSPIKTIEGVPYTTPATFAFHTGGGVCKISFVDIIPNPASFNDTQMECKIPPANPQCLDQTPKTIIATAKDATGLELSAVSYTWRKTVDYSGSYSTKYYSLDQPPTPNVNASTAWQKHLTGVDYNEVTAIGNGALNLGTATAQGQMIFGFCENPWFGNTPAGDEKYYLDPDYDFKLAYCMDSNGSNKSDPAKMLPNLPAPHIVRSASQQQLAGSDLLKEHIFIVGTTNPGTSSTYGDTYPYFITPTPNLTQTFKMNDLVTFKLDAKDNEGDSFVYVMTNESGDPLPASANFNQKTGVFYWFVDQLPKNGNSFILTFNLNPSAAGPLSPPYKATVTINVQGSVSQPIAVKPVVQFSTVTVGSQTTTSAEGKTITVNYGDSPQFVSTVSSLGSLGVTAAASIKSYFWDFQDSGLSTFGGAYPTYTATHTFLQPGSHQVTVRVQNNQGTWSNPAVVNIVVLAKTSLRQYNDHKVSSGIRGSISAVTRAVVSLFSGQALGQTAVSAPSNLAAQSIDSAINVQVSWQNNAVYDSIELSRNGTVIAPGPASGATTYLDGPFTAGFDLTYKVCGIISGVRYCSQITTTARNADYDVIVARVYKNVYHLSVSEWYKQFAPNPTGSPQAKVIDGYDALVDGTSVYIGVANCVNAVSGLPGASCKNVYTNILLLSYNQGAQKSTIDIFNQLLDNLRINFSLTTRDDTSTAVSCSGDSSIACDDLHDAICSQKNAGLCTTAKAELRRDLKRIVDLHDIASKLYAYADQNRFCNDGTNSRACNTDKDCPAPKQCVKAFPALSSGSYLGGMSTSKWPSWNQTLATALDVNKLETDPIDKFGNKFYTVNPASCTDYPGFDKDTCWNKLSLKFQCPVESEVYMYKVNNVTSFSLYGYAEATGWNWIGQDPNVKTNVGTGNDGTYGGLCTASPVHAVCGNGVIEPPGKDGILGNADDEKCDGGSANFCDVNFGDKNWNTDFKVGCASDCKGWATPAGATIVSCGGVCGDNTVNSPIELCDPNVAGSASAYSCTVGGNAYCSNTCQVACTAGRPYTGGYCGDGKVNLPEACDEGALLNGTPGHCNLTCSGYGSFCGDSVLAPDVVADIGCKCDSPAPSCASGSLAMGSSCTLGGCVSAHNYTCVKTVEECDNVIGLTSYSCPVGTTLYCDTSCSRACSNIDIAAVTGTRTTVPIYESYKTSSGVDDYDYSLADTNGTGYSTKAIAFYGYPTGGVKGNVTLNRYFNPTTGEHYIGTGALAGYISLGPLFKAFSTDQDLLTGKANVCSNDMTKGCMTSTDCGGKQCIIGGISVPVYEFKQQSGNDYYYSRNKAARTDSKGVLYVIQNSGNQKFYAEIGPFQEACGNDIVEGSETCEPDIFKTPLSVDSSPTNQYSCGAPLTANACQVYGGYCGDGGHCSSVQATACLRDSDCSVGDTCVLPNTPYEQCDAGSLKKCLLPLAAQNTCTTGNDCLTNYCTTSGCRFGGKACSKDSDCELNTCVANGALCNNNGGNCTYCSASCNKVVLPRNYCGDGLVNCGINTPKDCSDKDPFTEVCDDGVKNNGQPGFCNATCSGKTGAICGDGTVDQICSTDPSNDCSDATKKTACTTASGTCGGEVCDDGINNGTWGYVCVGGSNAGASCTTGSATCTGGGSCTGIRQYCNFSCLGPTTPVCGDSVIQSYPIPGNPGFNEMCDQGSLNGTTGNCNLTCDGITASVCGNNIIDNGRCLSNPSITCTTINDTKCAPGDTCVGVGRCSITQSQSCQTNFQCPAGETCTGVESCDPPASTTITNCTDTSISGGAQGLQSQQCTMSCQLIATQCHAFGLKIWSDGTDVAYINGKLALLGTAVPPAVCLADPAPNGETYSVVASPAGGNSCLAVGGSGTGKVTASFPASPPTTPSDLAVNGSNLAAIGWHSQATSDQWTFEKRDSTVGLLQYSNDALPETLFPARILFSGSYMYIVGTQDPVTPMTTLSRIEKRQISDGHLCSGAGYCGGTGFNYGTNGGPGWVGLSTATDYSDAAIDATNVYAVGLGGAPMNARLTGTKLSDGLCAAGWPASCTQNGNATFLRATAIDIDSTYMYLAGQNTDFTWRIEKRTKSNGVLTLGFGVSGIKQDTENTNTINHIDQVKVIGSSLYIIGYKNRGAAGEGLFIEKRDATTGALDTNFSTMCSIPGIMCLLGAKEVSKGNAFYQPVTTDGTYLYIAYEDKTTSAGKIEKRLASDGSPVSFGSNICEGLGTACVNDTQCAADPLSVCVPNSILTDPATQYQAVTNDGTYLYLLTYGGSSSQIWKRRMDTGAFETTQFGATVSASVPDQGTNALYTTASTVSDSDVRPTPPLASSWEQDGQNTIAIKVWAPSTGVPRGFEAVYTSPTVNYIFPTKAQSLSWSCSNTYTPLWNQIDCPTCNSTNGWSAPFSNMAPSCTSNYKDFVGGGAQWIWGSSCSNTVAGQTVYCRLQFNVTLPVGSTGYKAGEYCGDGIKNGPDVCDNGSANNGDCPKTCKSTCDAINSCGGGGGGGGGGGYCFVAGTKVLTPDGTKNIEKLVAGDPVMSYDPVTQEEVVSHVVQPVTALRDHYYWINRNIKVTAEHRFAIQTLSGLQWREVQFLTVGDIMIGERELVPIRSIQRYNLSTPIQVYNPTLAEPHTYYVVPEGESPILVHNLKCLNC